MEANKEPLKASFVSHLRGAFVCFIVFASSLILLGWTIPHYGITWDEAETNFPAARRQVEWFRQFLSGANVLNDQAVRAYFETESDHPSLPRTFMAASRLMVPATFSDRTAFAFSTSFLVSLFSAFLFALMRPYFGFWLSLFGTLVLFFHPHWFAHAHFAEYDILVAMAWFIAAWAFLWAVDDTRIPPCPWGRSLLASIALGLAVSIKVHALFLPFPLITWVVVYRKWNAWRWLVLSIPVVPTIYILTQPFLWWNTVDRVLQRFLDYGAKVPISVFYFGQIYPGDVPWHYPWVMLLVTLPIGMVVSLILRILTIRRVNRPCFPREPPWPGRWEVFFFLNAVTLPLLFTWKSAYDGVRFFLSSLPFLALISVQAFWELGEKLRESVGHRFAGISAGCSLGFLIAIQGYTCWRLHPYQLSYYSFLIGGVRGGEKAGLETTYWCDAVTPRFVADLAQLIPPAARIATHAMDSPTLVEYQRMGVAPETWRFVKEGPADCRLLQFRQGFFGLQEIRLQQERKPLKEVALDGVPLVRAYPGP